MPSTPRTTVASKACDACRTRKVKCDLGRPATIPTAGTDARCRRCTRLDLICTFDRPSGHRGPRRKRFLNETLSVAAPPISPVAISPAANVGVGNSPTVVAPSSHAASTPILFTPEHQRHHAFSTASPDQYHGYLGQQHLSSIPVYPTDGLCARPLVRIIIDDYLRLVYPLVPVVHKPSFQQALSQDRDVDSSVFLSLLLAICSITVGLMPSRFAAYRAWQPGPPLRFEGREEMMNYCYNTIIRLRGPRYFDEINFEKLAVSYILAVTFFQIGDQNRSRMMEVEAMQLGRLLQLHKIREYEGLSCVEKQLRKKGFWLLFYAYVHSELQNLRKERLSFLDASMLASLNLEELLPLDVDDEQIEEDRVLPKPGDGPCLTTAFIIHSRVFWAALRPINEQQQPPQEPPCICRPWRNRAAQITHLRGRLHEIKYMLDVLPAELMPWASSPAGGDDILGCQFASLRANLHVTHLWLQSIILDQLEADPHKEDEHSSSSNYFVQREDIARQLLHLLHAIPERDIEPNGLHLAFKVRDIAVGLLDDETDVATPNTPSSQRTPASAKRAAAYIDELTRILARLDRSEQANIVNLQSWVDTGRMRTI
ncbi:hypothetical protein SBRCBS47491_007499 [Sporothrix bragantina]|uniref:Zn(2)-C6 fungal-type domain-containing protein n=1 Tax=Sporothrix bragantina TaxID=671064 RepID=A0ABP0CDN7_9PEZI